MNEDALQMQVSLLTSAIGALFLAHPNKAELRKAFEHMYSTYQVGAAMLSVDPENRSVAKQIYEMLKDAAEE